MTLPKIPKSKDKQIEQLERAVFEMTEWLMRELGWDNPSDVADGLSDEVNLISQRAYERNEW